MNLRIFIWRPVFRHAKNCIYSIYRHNKICEKNFMCSVLIPNDERETSQIELVREQEEAQARGEALLESILADKECKTPEYAI